MLRVSGVTVRFGGIVALDDVSFDVRRGEIAGLIGPNGAGKTTLFNCLSRLYDWQQGSIEFDGTALASVRRHRIAELGIGRTFQNLALFRTMSVRDNIKVGAHCCSRGGFLASALRLPVVGREEPKVDERTDSLIDLLELGAVADIPAADLPFGTQKRVELGRAIADWNLHGDVKADHPNVKRLLARSEDLVEAIREKLKRTKRPHRDLQLYEDVVLFVLYYRFREFFDHVIDSAPSKRGPSSLATCFSRFEKMLRHLFSAPPFDLSGSSDAAHLFAIFFQVKRAFHFIFRNIIGTSQPAARFRAAAWQSVFTHDLRRYKAVLYGKMGDITTLITGALDTRAKRAAGSESSVQPCSSTRYS